MKAEGRIKEKADIGIRINPQVYLFQEKMKEKVWKMREKQKKNNRKIELFLRDK